MVNMLRSTCCGASTWRERKWRFGYLPPTTLRRDRVQSLILNRIRGNPGKRSTFRRVTTWIREQGLKTCCWRCVCEVTTHLCILQSKHLWRKLILNSCCTATAPYLGSWITWTSETALDLFQRGTRLLASHMPLWHVKRGRRPLNNWSSGCQEFWWGELASSSRYPSVPAAHTLSATHSCGSFWKVEVTWQPHKSNAVKEYTKPNRLLGKKS